MVISCLIVSHHPRQALPVRPDPRLSIPPNSNVQPRISNLFIFYYIRMVIPLDWYVASTYPLCLPLLRKLPGCIPIIPRKELPRPASPLRSLRKLSVSALDSSASPSAVSGRVSRIPFTINTSKSVSKQTTSTSFRINTYGKHGGRGVLWLTRLRPGRARRQRVPCRKQRTVWWITCRAHSPLSHAFPARTLLSFLGFRGRILSCSMGEESFSPLWRIV